MVPSKGNITKNIKELKTKVKSKQQKLSKETPIQIEQELRKTAETILPTDYGQFTMKIYEPGEHVVLQKGNPEINDNILVRVHSECLTGEVFLSKKCDCKIQLNKALEKISNEDKGIILYMRQEGRGIGLTNKIKAYSLQEKGLDTVDANQKLGFAADLRQYGITAKILADLGIHNIRLITNNPAKIIGLREHGLNIIERVPLEFPSNDKNQSYLKTKKNRMGHLLNLV